MKKLAVSKRAVRAIKQGAPLLTEYTFEKEVAFEEGEIVTLLTPENQFLAMAYLAKQNKGLGWVYSHKEGTTLNRAFFKEQFQGAKNRRQLLLHNEETNAFRLFNAEGDGIPGLTVDYYNQYAVFSWYSEGIYTYQDEIIQAFKEVFPFIKGAYEKHRYQANDEQASSYLYGEEAPAPLLVRENGIQYATYLDEGWMTGIFLDQRHVRNAILEKYAAGRTVLNTFSYTGAFSVAAAMGGAVHTTSVDVANRSLEKTREQFEVNGLNPDDHTIRVMDVFDYLRYAKRNELLFDLIVVDPPSFARTKKRTFSVTKDYSGMIEELIDIASNQGTFIFSSNAASYKRDSFLEDIKRAFTKKGKTFRLVEEFSLPEDFPAPKSSHISNYLKVFVIQLVNK
ncbi:class I SAM-dependent rRNA methyltransferase [Jeotgalibaca caeni]|uniref:class I SAM-dependent rRNA methyltransferase n=1 Tax=Jeotgalibaca caeni TaxID=3028623 RepID=UPI00237E6808|nr:class I SAM-dependent rRNA methyltransferase [Jeotgalibaca caeni]MDE1547704.1 class I SAM-dependent rRNA methyltransferase [Jeotgalibaca caeni]